MLAYDFRVFNPILNQSIDRGMVDLSVEKSWIRFTSDPAATIVFDNQTDAWKSALLTYRVW